MRTCQCLGETRLKSFVDENRMSPRWKKGNEKEKTWGKKECVES